MPPLSGFNAIISKHAKQRQVSMPRIGPNHAGSVNGIFSLLLYSRGGPEETEYVDVVINATKDGTAKWCKELYDRLGIPTSAITPWNAFGSSDEKPSMKAINENLPLCKELVSVAQPVALIAQGVWAHKMADRLGYSGLVRHVPNPSRQGRNSYKGWHEQDADKIIEAAFQEAFRQVKKS